MGMDAMAAYAAAKETSTGSCPRRGNGAPGPDRRRYDGGRLDGTGYRAQNGPRHRLNRRYLTLLFDGLRPAGQRLPAARSESPSGSANREPRRSHERPCSVGRPDTQRP